MLIFWPTAWTDLPDCPSSNGRCTRPRAALPARQPRCDAVARAFHWPFPVAPCHWSLRRGSSMFSKTKAALLPVCVAACLHLVPAPAQAQTQAGVSAAATATGSRPDPADATVRVPAAQHTSPLRAYQAFTDPQVTPWRDNNALVRQRGGWRAYAREALEPDAAATVAPAAPRPAAPVRPAPGGHAGHPAQ